METHPLDEDTLLTTTYCLIDDLYRTVATHARRRGPPPALSDSEVLALTVLAQIKHLKSERRLIRHAREHWRAYFPHLVSQSEFNRRARDLMSLLACITSRLAHATEMTYGLSGAFEVIDGTPLPVMRRCRAKREHSFTPDADFGWGGSDRDQYYGLKLLVSVTESGFITGFLAGPANTEERWLAEALLRYRTDVTAIAPSSEQMRLVLGPTHKSGGERKGPSGRLGPRYGVGKASLAC